MNHKKFRRLWEIATNLKATLYLVNYAKKGTTHEDEILLIKVIEMDDSGILREEKRQFTRKDFSEWFRNLNKECLEWL